MHHTWQRGATALAATLALAACQATPATTAAPTPAPATSSGACEGDFSQPVDPPGWVGRTISACTTTDGLSIEVTNTGRVSLQVKAAPGAQLLPVAGAGSTGSTGSTDFSVLVQRALAAQMDDPDDSWTSLAPGRSAISDGAPGSAGGVMVAVPTGPIMGAWVSDLLTQWMKARTTQLSANDAATLARCSANVVRAWRGSTSTEPLTQLLATTALDGTTCRTLLTAVADRSNEAAPTAVSLADQFSSLQRDFDVSTLSGFAPLAHASVTVSPGST